MNTEKTALLIEALNDHTLSLLSDIAQLSYPTFLRRVGNKLSLTDSHYLYQQAIHSGKRQTERKALVRGNPQLRQIIHLAGTSTPTSDDTEFSSATLQSVSGEQP